MVWGMVSTRSYTLVMVLKMVFAWCYARFYTLVKVQDKVPRRCCTLMVWDMVTRRCCAEVTMVTRRRSSLVMVRPCSSSAGAKYQQVQLISTHASVSLLQWPSWWYQETFPIPTRSWETQHALFQWTNGWVSRSFLGEFTFFTPNFPFWSGDEVGEQAGALAGVPPGGHRHSGFYLKLFFSSPNLPIPSDFRDAQPNASSPDSGDPPKLSPLPQNGAKSPRKGAPNAPALGAGVTGGVQPSPPWR